MGLKSTKQRQNISVEPRAHCPFTVATVSEKGSGRASRKRKAQDGDHAHRKPTQVSPFMPEGKFISNQSMDMSYTIEPQARWQSMARYRNFLLNGYKYTTDDFVYVANDASVDAQEPASRQEEGSLPPSIHHWVARILEIRAADEQHVYARIFWMYSPEELPSNTRQGEETIEGRQPYHGREELIASNHMDVINVVSIVAVAQVHQWIESNDDEAHGGLYWRQAFNLKTLELSSAQLICKCGVPARPEELLICCTSQDCGQWLHERCLRHAVLKRACDRHLADDGKAISNRSPPDTGNVARTAIQNELRDSMFTATLINGDGLMHWEITDHRVDGCENKGTWKEQVDCLICGTTIE